MFLPCLFAVFLPCFTVFQYSLHFIVVKVTFSYSCCAFWVQIVYGMERSFNEDGNGRDPEFTLPLIHVDEIFMSKLGPNGTGSSGLGRGKVSGCFCVPPRFITVWTCLDRAFHVFVFSFCVFSTLWLAPSLWSIFLILAQMCLQNLQRRCWICGCLDIPVLCGRKLLRQYGLLRSFQHWHLF